MAEWGEDRRQSPREHRLADTRWPDQQQMVRARGRDRQRVSRVREAPDVGEIEGFVARGPGRDGGRGIGWIGPRHFALQAGVELAQASRHAHLDARYERGL